MSSTAVPRFLTLPFSDASTRLTQGWTYEGYADGQFHGGIDWSLEPGTPILAAADGVAMASEEWQYGNFVSIKHDNGYFTLYAHLDRAVPTLKSYPESQRANTDYGKWTPVRAGDVIGYCGNDGALGGDYPHLHFELRTSAWGRQREVVIDPFGIYGRANHYCPEAMSHPAEGYAWTTDPPSPASEAASTGNEARSETGSDPVQGSRDKSGGIHDGGPDMTAAEAALSLGTEDTPSTGATTLVVSWHRVL